MVVYKGKTGNGAIVGIIMLIIGFTGIVLKGSISEKIYYGCIGTMLFGIILIIGSLYSMRGKYLYGR